MSYDGSRQAFLQEAKDVGFMLVEYGSDYDQLLGKLILQSDFLQAGRLRAAFPAKWKRTYHAFQQLQSNRVHVSVLGKDAPFFREEQLINGTTR